MLPSSPSSPVKTTSLSYAERVKKTQNIRSPNSIRPLASTSNPSTTIVTSTSSTSAGAPHNPNSHSPTAFATASSSAVQNGPESIPSSSLPDAPSVKPVNGDPHRNSDLTSAALSIVAAHSSSQKPPPVNVWSVRKMAQAQSQGKTPASQTSSQNVPQLSPTKNLPQISVRPSANDTDLPPAPQRASDSRQNGNHRANTKVSINGITEGMTNAIDDPFVVRVYAQPPRGPSLSTQPPSIDDTESWPEVGKAVSNETTSHQGTPIIESPRERNGQGEDIKESAVGVTPRKGEKTKWVPIPAEELQAAADALQASNRRSRSRNHSHHRHSAPKHGGNSRNNPSSGSGSVQGHSRTHSGRNSLSQSQVQSRAGSVQSSPRHNTRGRKLPNEDLTGGSGTAAIEVVSRSSPQPQADSGPGGLVGQSVTPYGPGHQQTGSGTTTYPNIPVAVHSHPPQDQRQRLRHSPLQGSYNLPESSEYSALNSALLPVVQPLQPSYPAGMNPYPLYPPYGNYKSTQPLVIYGSEQHSPSYRPPLPLFSPQHAELQQPFARPPPPEEPEAVTANRGDGVPPDRRDPEGAAEAQERRMTVVFGSIGLPGSSKGPSPSPRVVDEEPDNAADGEEIKSEKTFTFSIGVAPGEPGPSRARSAKVRRQTAPAKVVSDVPNHDTSTATEEAREEKEDDPKVERKVIDLTETKWAFGTIKSPPTHNDKLDGDELPLAEPYSSPKAPDMPLVEQPPQVLPAPLPPVPSHPIVQTSALGLQPIIHLTSPINGLPMAAPFPVQRTVIPLLTSDAGVGAGAGSEWEVKDYGYGFGHGGYVPHISREERLGRDRERERERLERERLDLERERVEREGQRDREITGRPRRGSYGGGYGGYERGGFGGRRGRAGSVNGAYGGGRGFNTRGGRGGYQPQPQPQPQTVQPLRQPPFTITPPPQFQQLSPLPDPSTAYYLPRQNLATYIPTGYETYQPPPPVPTTHTNAPPVPVPLSTLSFPLDPVRTYLLGQLEYYLSPQNMAQDFFLRQRMDSRGWIPISLIASFNRVRMLTLDPQLVREVLVLSTVVEVHEDWVRMIGWEQFVLPDAARSTAEGPTYAHVEYLDHSSSHSSTGGNIVGQERDADGEIEDCEAEAEEDTEEEVEFVLERESQSWSPEQRRQV